MKKRTDEVGRDCKHGADGPRGTSDDTRRSRRKEKIKKWDGSVEEEKKKFSGGRTERSEKIGSRRMEARTEWRRGRSEQQWRRGGERAVDEWGCVVYSSFPLSLLCLR